MLGLGTPGKLYSILASGRPIIGMVPSAGEVALILKEEDCGINVADGMRLPWLAKFFVCRVTASLAGRMGRNARRALEQRFTLQHAVEGFIRSSGRSWGMVTVFGRICPARA